MNSPEAAADNYGLKVADLKDGAIRETDKNTSLGLGNLLVAVKGKHLYLSHSRKALASVLEGKPLSAALACPA